MAMPAWPLCQQPLARSNLPLACLVLPCSALYCPVLQKLMEKMGWKEGEGLGRNRQGMATPLMMQASVPVPSQPHQAAQLSSAQLSSAQLRAASAMLPLCRAPLALPASLPA